jgi:hypothetical protein
MTPAAGDGAGGRRGTPGREVHIDRLALRVAGLDEGAAQALARRVAEGLAPGIVRSAPSAGLGHLHVVIDSDPAGDHDPDVLASRITTAIGRALARDRVSGAPDAEGVR